MVEVPRHHQPMGERLGRWFSWQRLVAAVLVLVVAGVGLNSIRDDAEDRFIAFQPDVSLFPAAPMADAETLVGIGRPEMWPTSNCRYWDDRDDGLSSVYGDAWHTVRHDWSEGGSPKAWVVSERTFAFDDLNGFDNYISSMYDKTKYCGWDYQGAYSQYNSVFVDLDGLPDDAFAFTIDASPFNDGQDTFEGSRADDFSALGAIVPRRNPDSVMAVIWVGWAAEVPTDEFVAAVNTLYDAAKRAPEPVDATDSDAAIDFDFQRFNPDTLGLGDDSAPGFTDGNPWSSRCQREQPTRILVELAEPDGDSGLRRIDRQDERIQFGAARWRSRRTYLEAKRRALDIVEVPCIDSLQQPGLLIEPVPLDGLPDGATVSVWHERFDAYAAVVTDDAKQTMMIIEWWYGRPASDEEFVEVVNEAWTTFQTQNP